MSCPIKVNGNTIVLTVHISCYCVLDLLCVTFLFTTDFYDCATKLRMVVFLECPKQVPADIDKLPYCLDW